MNICTMVIFMWCLNMRINLGDLYYDFDIYYIFYKIFGINCVGADIIRP